MICSTPGLTLIYISHYYTAIQARISRILLLVFVLRIPAVRFHFSPGVEMCTPTHSHTGLPVSPINRDQFSTRVDHYPAE